MTRPSQLARYCESIAAAVGSVPPELQQAFVDEILAAQQIVVAGRGRSGMMGAAFARRLGQMGLKVWGLDDTTVPRLGSGDLLVACTGSGTTPTVLSLMDTARSGGARVLAVIRAPVQPEVAEVADVIAALAVPSADPNNPFPLGTLFEVSCLAFLDQVVVDLLAALGQAESDLGARHTNLE